MSHAIRTRAADHHSPAMRRPHASRTLMVATFLGVTAASAAVFANTYDSDPRPQPPPAAKPQPAAARMQNGPATPLAKSAVRKPIPGLAQQHIYLVRATLMALDDANRTGNYTVLRDRAGAAFRAKNSAADLAQTFHGFRTGRVDLGLAALLEPELLAPPQRPNAETLVLTGRIPLAPQALVFELGFVAEGGQWKLDQLSVGLAQPTPRPKA